MTYLRFEPVRSFEKLSKKFNEFANEFEKGISFEMGGFKPRVDITEDDKYIYIIAETPGMKKEDIKISINEERILTIRGEKIGPERSDSDCCIRKERIFGTFDRSFILPETTDVEKIDAKYENGVLTLTIGKKEPAKPKEYNVTIS